MIHSSKFVVCFSAGTVSINVSGVLAPAAAQYDFGTLVQSPEVVAMTPLRGSTAGDTVVTIVGQRFAGDATVLFAERTVAGVATGAYAECSWRTSRVSGVLCNDTVIK